MTIPWDDDAPPRPDFLPYPGEPIDHETAALIAARYLDAVRAMLTEIAATVAGRYPKGQLWTRIWTAELIVRFWGNELNYVLLGFVMVDMRAVGGTFDDVGVLLDKESGELRVFDPHGLLRG